MKKIDSTIYNIVVVLAVMSLFLFSAFQEEELKPQQVMTPQLDSMVQIQVVKFMKEKQKECEATAMRIAHVTAKSRLAHLRFLKLQEEQRPQTSKPIKPIKPPKPTLEIPDSVLELSKE